MNEPIINNTITHLKAYSQVMAFKAIGRKRRRTREREERGTLHGTPMSTQVRASVYAKQNGTDRLTPKQAKRMARTALKNAVRDTEGRVE